MFSPDFFVCHTNKPPAIQVDPSSDLSNILISRIIDKALGEP